MPDEARDEHRPGSGEPSTTSQWRELFDRLPQCVGLYAALRDDRGRIIDFEVLYVNHAACVNNKLTSEQQVGKRLNDLLPGHRESGLFAAYCKVVDTGQPLQRRSFEYTDVYGDRLATHAFDIDVQKHGDGFLAVWRKIELDTPREDIERALRESERRFHALADAVPQLVWVASGEASVEYYNAQASRYDGIRRKPDGSWDWQPVVHPDELDETVRRWNAAIGSGQTYECQHRVRMADGQWRWHLSRAYRVEEDDGRARWFGTATDIHDGVQAQAAAREMAERLRLAVENSPISLYECDRELRYTWIVNPMEGFDSADIIGQRDEDLLPAGQAQELAGFKRLVLDDGQPAYRQFEPVIDGTPRRFDLYAEPVHDPAGAVTGVRVAAVDTTELFEAERAVRDAERRSSLAQHIGGVGTFEFDIATGVNHWSPELEALYGLSPGAFAGTYDAWLELVHPDDRERAAAGAQRAFEDGADGDFEGEWRIVLPGGEVRWLEARAWIERDGHDRPVRMIGVNLDITERKAQERYVQTILDELNHRVKNTLAVVGSIATQTQRRSPDPRAFAKDFNARLSAIAKAHDLLAKRQMEGCPLEEIIRTELAPRLGAPGQLSLEGPQVVLEPRRCLSLHMVVHEMSTNAAKYGALRTAEGRIDVRWSLAERDGRERVRLRWQERCPSPVGPDGQPGYGSTLIAQIVEHELGGSLERTLEASGMRYDIELPLGIGAS
ncbi:MAG: PAS domain-containing protein [Phycisphaerales bacterium]